MRKIIATSIVIALAHALPVALAIAAVPIRWTVETSRYSPATFDFVQGESLALEAALKSDGRPLEIDGDPSLFWQTNGMGSAWWSVPATASNNVLTATWSPSNDVGATAYRCFIGVTGSVFRAAFNLRVRTGPGAHPNDLPLPQPVIDFSRVTVLNPPWSGGGGGGGVDTNAVIDIVSDTLASNGIRRVDGAARPLPKYLHALDFDDTYPDDAEAWYESLSPDAMGGACSVIRDGGLLGRNYDWNYDEAAEFVVRVSASGLRHASVGIASLGAALTEDEVASGVYSPKYRALPGMTLDGINDAGVVAAINVVPRNGGEPGKGRTRNLHPLAAVRYVLDNFSDASEAAQYVAHHFYIPETSKYSFHWMIADSTGTYIVEDSWPAEEDTGRNTMTNYRLFSTDTYGTGYARKTILDSAASVEDALVATRFTNAYATGWPWPDEFAMDAMIPHTETNALRAWADIHVSQHLDPVTRKPASRDGTLWHTVHSSIYDFTSKTMKVAVQEGDEHFTFAVDKLNVVPPSTSASAAGKAADAKATGDALAAKVNLVHDFTQAQAGGIFVSGGIEESDRGIRSTGGGGFTSVGGDYVLLDPMTGDRQCLSDKADKDRVDYLYTYIDGQTVRISITNYYGNTSGEPARMRIEECYATNMIVGGVSVPTNLWRTVWDEETKYSRLAAQVIAQMAATTNGLEQSIVRRLADKADRNWGKYTSAGGAAPPGKVWMTEPSTVFAGGTEYAHVTVGSGVISVLTAKGAAVYTAGAAGRFLFQTDDGSYYFGMNIQDRYELGCDTDGISVTSAGANKLVTLTYNVTMSGYPILYHATSLASPVQWEQLTDSSGQPVAGASVSASWEQSPPVGAQLAYVNCATDTAGFFKASVEYPGSTKFDTNMAIDAQGGILAERGDDKVAVEPYVENGEVKWRIKQ